MDDRLKKEIEHHKIGKIYTNNAENIQDAKRLGGGQRTQSAGTPLMPLSMNTQNHIQSEANLLPFEKKPQVFVRSQRSIAMRIKETYENQVNSLDQEKLDLIQKLNDALVHLDNLNQQKAELNDKLISLFKFNRDMERHTLKSNDLVHVVDESLKEELQQEKRQSISMREQLKFLEVERLRLSETLIEAETISEVCTKDKAELDQVMDLRDRDLSTLQSEYNETFAKVQAFQREVDELRTLCLALRDMIDGHKHDLHYTHDGQLSIIDQYSGLERKFASAIDLKQKEVQDIRSRNTRRKKLLGAHFIGVGLSKIAQLRGKYVFDFIKKRHNKAKATLQGLLRMRHILRQNRRHKLRKYLYQWYFTELSPLKNLNQTRILCKSINHRYPQYSIFYKWLGAFQSSTRLNHMRVGKLARVMTIRDEQICKTFRNFMLRWRMNTNLRFREWRKIQKLKQLINDHEIQNVRNRFYRWKAVSLELDNQIQLHGMLNRFTHQAYLSKLFHSWRTTCSLMKTKRLHKLSLIWKSLLDNVHYSKHLRSSRLLLLKESHFRSRVSLIQACFNALRQNKQQQKLLKVTHQLSNLELPLKQRTFMDLRNISQAERERMQRQAVKNVAEIRAKKVYQYIQKWKAWTEHRREVLSRDVKSRLIFRYRSVLHQAFLKWLNFRDKSIVHDQSLVIQQWEHSNVQLTSQIKSETYFISISKTHIKTQSAKGLKYLVMEAFERHLRVYFAKWRDGVHRVLNKEERLDRVIQKYEHRLKRSGFQMYLKKNLLRRKEAQEKEEGLKARGKVIYRMKVRYFQRVAEHAKRAIKAKKLVQFILTRLDVRNKDQAFKMWYNSFSQQREEALEEQKAKTISIVHQHSHQIGTLMDQVEEQTQSIRLNDHRYHNNCARTLTLAFRRFLNKTQQDYFLKWKAIIKVNRRTKQMMQDALNHAQRTSAAYYFKQWIHNTSVYMMQRDSLACIQGENQMIKLVKDYLSKARQQHDRDVESLSTKLTRCTTESTQLEKKHMKALSLLISRRDRNFHVIKLRYLWVNWSSYVKNRKKSLINLFDSLQKATWQTAFTSIKQQAIERARYLNKAKILTRHIRNMMMIKERIYFSQWRRQVQTMVNTVGSEAHKETNQLVKEHTKFVNTVHQRFEIKLVEDLQSTLLLNCFKNWKFHIDFEKSLRIKTQLFKNWRTQKQSSNAVHKWLGRHRLTKQLLTQKLKLLETRFLRMQGVAFVNWQKHNIMQKKLARALSNLANKVDVVYTKRAFMSLKENQDTQNTRRLFAKFKGSRNLTIAMQKVFQTRVCEYFNEVKTRIVKQQKEYTAVKSITKYFIYHKLRNSMIQWRQEAQRKQLIIQLNQEGPIAVERHNLYRELQALKSLCVQEGISKEKIQSIIFKQQQGSRAQFKKTISRLVCNGDPSLKVIPYCFDRWRQFVKVRKLYTYWLKFTDNFQNPRKHCLSDAFKRWKTLHEDIKVPLTKVPLEKLKKICVVNNDKMGNLASTILDSSAMIQDLTTQRDLLLKRYLSSQKLALSASKAQFDRTKYKCFSKWLSQNQRAEKSQLEEVLRLNLLKITNLKDKIDSLEGQNQHLAFHNEDLRQGALDGIEMAKNVDELTRERNKITIDIADKSKVIRRLLEDNQTLHHQLVEAQQSAQRLIAHTQMRLSSNGHL